MNYNSILVFIFLLVIFLIMLRIFIEPLKIAFKLLFSCIISGIGIFLFNILGGLIGLHIGLNFITILSVAFLGFPGLALLLFLQIIFVV